MLTVAMLSVMGTFFTHSHLIILSHLFFLSYIGNDISKIHFFTSLQNVSEHY